jgi:hypothetical protein
LNLLRGTRFLVAHFLVTCFLVTRFLVTCFLVTGFMVARVEELASRNLRRGTCVEELASRNSRRGTCVEELASRNSRRGFEHGSGLVVKEIEAGTISRFENSSGLAFIGS